MAEQTFPSPALTAPAGAELPARHHGAPAPGEAIPSHYHRCFGCGVDHPTGLHLSIVTDEGLAVRAELEVTEHHQGAPGLAHGGLLTTAFDEVMSALNWLLYRPAVTGRLEVQFRRPVPVASRLVLTARVDGVHGRKTFTSAEGRFDGPDGRLAVRAAAVFVAVPLEHFAEHARPADLAHAVTRSEVMDTTVQFEVNP